MYPDQLEKSVSSGSVAPIYFFVGENSGMIEAALHRISETLSSRGTAELDRAFFDASVHRPSDILQAARTVPFLSPEKLVVVRKANAYGKAEWDEFASYFLKPSKTCCIIFELNVPDKNVQTQSKPFEKHGVVVIFQGPTERNLRQYIQNHFKRHGKRITPAALEAFSRIVSLNDRQVLSEVEKVVLYCGGRKTVEEDDLCVVSERMRATIFNLIEAVVLGRLEESMVILDTMLCEGENPLGILKMLARQFRMILVARQYAGRRVSTADIAKKMGLRPNQHFLVGKVTDQARGWSFSRLAGVFVVLFETDCMLKVRGDKRVVLEQALGRLTAIRHEPAV